MSGTNKIILLVFSLIMIVIFVELGYIVYMKNSSPGYYSLSSVSWKKDYQKWLDNNSAITKSRLVNADKNTQLIINQTEGTLQDFVVRYDEVAATILTKKGPARFTFSSKSFKAYSKPANTREVLVPIDYTALKPGDRVILHESYSVINDSIKNTDNGIVRVE